MISYSNAGIRKREERNKKRWKIFEDNNEKLNFKVLDEINDLESDMLEEMKEMKKNILAEIRKLKKTTKHNH